MVFDQYIGRLLDERYEILEVIGTGGMAVVYKARCHRLNRLVAIKILKDEYARDEEFRRRFHAEGEAVAMLSHPNIVQVYDVSSTENANFIVMELIDGISLKQYMEKKGVLNWKETLHFAMQIAKGLEHAHSRGIVHRDIKPHNVMVLKNGSVKVMDFGIARVMNKSNTLTKEALGSVHYISPEQAKGGYTDNRSDLYSLSVVMYEMMTGRPPYDGESAVAVAIQHINGGAVMPSALNPNIPGGLEEIIMKGMALDVKDRYASATEMLLDMEEFRKNPAILFGYEYKTPMIDATRPMTVMQSVPPRTTAERVAQSKGGVKPRAGTDSARLRQAGGASAAAGTVKKRSTGAVGGAAGVSRGTGNMNRSTGNMNRSTGNMNRPIGNSDAIRRAQQRRREEEEQKREEERNRVATIAVVICSAVAVIAIIVFLVALFNGALLNQEKEYAIVPDLIGDVYTENFHEIYSDFEIVLRPQEYSNDYEKGQIIKQEPVGGSKVFKNTDLFITISLGKEPEVKVMEKLAGVTWENAESFLKGQGFEVLPREEASETYEAGLVTRTDPAEGTELKDGQTIHVWVSTGPEIVAMEDMTGEAKEDVVNFLEGQGFVVVCYDEPSDFLMAGTVIRTSPTVGEELTKGQTIKIWVSTGPAVVEAKMPGVIGKDQNYAMELLQDLGFVNVKIREVESTEAKGIVVSQSQEKGTKIDVTTYITLEVSKGMPSATTPVVPDGTQSGMVTKDVTFILPQKDVAYSLSIRLGGNEVIEPVTIPAGETSYTTELSGNGTIEYVLYIDGMEYRTEKVTFSDG